MFVWKSCQLTPILPIKYIKMFTRQFLDFPFPDTDITPLLSWCSPKHPHVLMHTFKKSLYHQEDLMWHDLANIKSACDHIRQLKCTLQGLVDVEECMVKTNKIVLDGLHDNNGIVSTLPRYTSHYHPTFASKESSLKAMLFLCDILNEILEEISQVRDQVERLKVRFMLASFFYCVFLELHPFPDGNGRTATLLLNYLLDLPFFAVVCTDRQKYLWALENSRQTYANWKDSRITEAESVATVYDIAKNCKPFLVCELLVQTALANCTKK